MKLLIEQALLAATVRTVSWTSETELFGANNRRVPTWLMHSSALIDLWYSDQMGNGKPIGEIFVSAADWRALSPNSVGEFVARKVCEYKK